MFIDSLFMGLNHGQRDYAIAQIPYFLEKLRSNPNYNIARGINNDGRRKKFSTKDLIEDTWFTKDLVLSIDSITDSEFNAVPVLSTVLKNLATISDDYENHRYSDTVYAARILAQKTAGNNGYAEELVKPLVDNFNKNKHAWIINELHCCNGNEVKTLYLN